MTGQVDTALRKARGLVRNGQPGEAAALYLDLLSRYPGNLRARQGLAEATRISDPRELQLYQSDITAVTDLLDLGQKDAALVCARALLVRSPHVHTFHTLLAQVLVRTGDRDAALAPLQTALRLAPDNVDNACNLAQLLIDLNRPSDVARVMAPAARNDPSHVLASLYLGKALNMLGQCEEAVQCYDRILARTPEDAAVLTERATALFALGRTAEAEADLALARRLAPGRTLALRLYCLETRVTAGDPVISEVEAALAGPDLPGAERTLLQFALAKVRHDLGEHAAAFTLWSEANARHKAAIGYELEEDQALFARLAAQARAGLPGIGVVALGCRRPVFVVGLPRSGTTLIEQILASHPLVFGAGERDALPQAVNSTCPGGAPPDPAALRRLREAYLANIAATTPEMPLVVDKMPSNFLLVPQIVAAFPDAVIIDARRDARATCWSNFRHFFPQGGQGTGFGHDLCDLAGYYRLYLDAMSLWDELYPGRILRICYEELCRDQRKVTERLLTHAGLQWHEGCMNFHETARAVTTTSADQVRRALYAGSSDSWRAYERWLGPLLEGLKGV